VPKQPWQATRKLFDTPGRLQYERYAGIVGLSMLEKNIEKRFGMAPTCWLERIGKGFLSRPTSELRVSGSYAWAGEKSSEEVKIAR